MKILFYYKGTENLGVEYLSSCLRKAGHKTDLIFDPGLDDNFFFNTRLLSLINFEKGIVQKIERFQPDLIAFSAITNLFKSIRCIAKKFKEELTDDIPMIVGGIHATSIPEYILKEKYFDMVCIGEGEEAITELANCFDSGKRPYHIKNIWFKDNGGIIRNPLRPLMSNLDLLPFPDKDLFHKYGVFSESYMVITSRGCPFSCTYCSNSLYRKVYEKWGVVRRRGIDNVIEELKTAKKKYKIKFIKFVDNIFAFNENWLDRFKKPYIEEIGLPFFCMIHPSLINDTIVRTLKEAGCVEMEMGIQSANENTRRILFNRNETNEQVIDAAKLIRKYDIRLHTDLIFGIPGEGVEDMWNSIELNREIHPNSTQPFILYPFPKTELAEYCIKEKLMSEDQIEKTYEGMGSYHTEILMKLSGTENIRNFHALTLLALKLPRSMLPFCKFFINKKHGYLHTFLYLLSIPFINPRDFIQRLVNFPKVLFCTMRENK